MLAIPLAAGLGAALLTVLTGLPHRAPSFESMVRSEIQTSPEYSGIEREQGRIKAVRCGEPTRLAREVRGYVCHIDFARVSDQFWSVRRDRRDRLELFDCINRICN